ncbi:nitrous oxide reductase family maturation protein NosD [Citricoccus nitrophenolicus]|uniref:right-handed parallel beta-helix repeat-containing protein n=1 Tax=Citricoccus nitrophenolicus TaxID=863575 RepID=UPI0039B4C956
MVAGFAGFSLRETVKSDRQADSLQAAVDACEPGDLLEVSRTWITEGPIILDKPLKISSTTGGSVRTSGDYHAFVVLSGGVWFKNLSISGQGAELAGTQSAIHARGDLERPLFQLRIEGCEIAGFSKYGIEGWHIRDFTILDNTIKDIAYGAVMILSGRDGVIEGNSIHNVTQPKGFSNSYGIALTHNSAVSSDEAPRSEQIAIRNNTVEAVTKWEGIDTHGGRSILVEGNEVLNCRVGIALVPGANADDPALAPRDFLVRANTVRSAVTDGSRLHGIQVAGALLENSDLSQVAEYATGAVEGNTIVGHGSATIANSGAIFIRTTEGLRVKGNTIVEPNPAGILCYHTNQKLSLQQNLCIDAWSDTHLYTSMIRVVSDYQSIAVEKNRLLRRARVALRVNTAGLSGSSASGRLGVTVAVVPGNDFSAALIPVGFP